VDKKKEEEKKITDLIWTLNYQMKRTFIRPLSKWPKSDGDKPLVEQVLHLIIAGPS